MFFAQARVGYRGRVFAMIKLRTMQMGEARQSHFTRDSDPRVTRVGALLRKYRIDEFPQIWNILKGEMSLSARDLVTPAGCQLSAGNSLL